MILLGDEKYREAILTQVRAQTKEHLLVVVEGVQPVGKARNVAIKRALEAGADVGVFFDSDDLYSEGYLATVEKDLEGSIAVGKPQHYILDTTSGQYYLAGKARDYSVVPPCGPGGTLAVRLEHALPFAEDIEDLEDLDWCLRMGSIGKPIKTTSPNGYMKRQFGSGHTCKQAFDEIVRRCKRLPCEPSWRR